MSIAGARICASCSVEPAERLPNSLGWKAERVRFPHLPDPRHSIRGKPLSGRVDDKPPYGIVSKYFGLVERFLVPAIVDGKLTTLELDPTSFQKRTGQDPASFKSQRDFENWLQRAPLQQAFPQLPDREIEAILASDQQTHTVREWGVREGRLIQQDRVWNLREGRFVDQTPFEKTIEPLRLPFPRFSPFILTEEDQACLEREVKRLYVPSWERICSTKKVVREEIRLPSGARCTFEFKSDGSVSAHWIAYGIDRGTVRIHVCQWDLLEDNHHIEEKNPGQACSQKLKSYAIDQPEKFKAQLRAATQHLLTATQIEAITSYLSQRYIPGRYVSVDLEGITLAIKGDDATIRFPRRTVYTFNERTQKPEVSSKEEVYSLFSLPEAREEDAHIITEDRVVLVENNLTAGGVSLDEAQKIAVFVQQVYDKIMAQVKTTNRPVVVECSPLDLPYKLEFLPSGRVWVRIELNSNGSSFAGATKTAEFAISLFEPEIKAARLEALLDSPGAENRVREEFRMLKQVERIPHVVKPIELIESTNERGQATVVLYEERCHLGPLSHHLNHLSQEQKMKIAGDVIKTVAALREQGIVHRDLKPDNIFLRHTLKGPFSRHKEIEAVIGDFDIARRITDLNADLPIEGTPLYFCPRKAERFAEGSGWIGHFELPSEVWALGLVLWEIFAPEGEVTEDGIARLRSQGCGRRVTQSKDSMTLLIGRMLERDHVKRATIEQVVAEWKKIEKKQKPQPVEREIAPPHSPIRPGAPRTPQQGKGNPGSVRIDLDYGSLEGRPRKRK